MELADDSSGAYRVDARVVRGTQRGCLTEVGGVRSGTAATEERPKAPPRPRTDRPTSRRRGVSAEVGEAVGMRPPASERGGPQGEGGG